MSLFLRNEDPHVHLSAANYILRRVQVQCGWLKSDWDHVWVGSGCQIPGTVLWWQACVFHLVSACACFMPYTFVFCLCRPYAGIFVLVFVLFRPCSSYLFLISTHVVLLATFLILHHILQNYCRLFFCLFSSYFSCFSVWLVLFCSRTRYASISLALP